MKHKITLLLLSVLLMSSCTSVKLSKTTWYNSDKLYYEGTTNTIGTTLYFDTDSTLVIFKGVAKDTTVVAKPFVYALGEYQITKEDKNSYSVTFSAQNIDGGEIKYAGTYNKKEKLMRLHLPESEVLHTYLWIPKGKIKVKYETQK